MAWSDVLTTMMAKIAEVTDVPSGTLHDYLRHSATQTERDDLYRDDTNGIIHTWQFTRVAAPSQGGTASDIWRAHEVHLHCWREVDDSAESEKTFQDLLDTIMNKFNGNRNLAASYAITNAANLLVAEHQMYAGVLCHHGIVQLFVEEDVGADAS